MISLRNNKQNTGYQQLGIKGRLKNQVVTSPGFSVEEPHTSLEKWVNGALLFDLAMMGRSL